MKKNNSLVLYFSATGTTKKVAHMIKEITDSDTVEIIPEQIYTNEDLNYNDNNCRANNEQSDDKARPKIKNNINIENYDTIYLGYPIWWGTFPKIILTLFDLYNFDQKNIILFCTSGSSEIKQSSLELKNYNSNINILGEKRFGSNTTEDDIKSWLRTININEN